jgi:hypothetical protein
MFVVLHDTDHAVCEEAQVIFRLLRTSEHAHFWMNISETCHLT